MEKDSDYDGLPDAFEIQYSAAPCNLDPNNPDDAVYDCDNDLVSNLVEYQFGSDPFDDGDKPSPGNYFKYNSNGRIKKITRVQ